MQEACGVANVVNIGDCVWLRSRAFCCNHARMDYESTAQSRTEVPQSFAPIVLAISPNYTRGCDQSEISVYVWCRLTASRWHFFIDNFLPQRITHQVQATSHCFCAAAIEAVTSDSSRQASLCSEVLRQARSLGRNAISGSFSTRAGRCVTPYQPGAEGSILLLIPLYLVTSRWCRTFGEIRSSKRLVSTKRVQ